MNSSTRPSTTIRFSDYELAIIQQRGLHNQTVATGHTNAIPADESIEGWRYVRRWAPLYFFGAVAMYLYNHDFQLLIAIPIIFGAWAYSWIWLFLHKGRFDQAKITVHDVLQTPTFSFWAPTPFHSKILAFDVRKQLQHIKQVINESAELGDQETFEL